MMLMLFVSFSLSLPFYSMFVFCVLCSVVISTSISKSNQLVKSVMICWTGFDKNQSRLFHKNESNKITFFRPKDLDFIRFFGNSKSFRCSNYDLHTIFSWKVHNFFYWICLLRCFRNPGPAEITSYTVCLAYWAFKYKMIFHVISSNHVNPQNGLTEFKAISVHISHSQSLRV